MVAASDEYRARSCSRTEASIVEESATVTGCRPMSGGGRSSDALPVATGDVSAGALAPPDVFRVVHAMSTAPHATATAVTAASLHAVTAPRLRLLSGRSIYRL